MYKRQLAHWLEQPDTLRRRLAANLPPLPMQNLRDCQVSAVTGLEASLARNRPRALVHMATGAGKTFTAVPSVSASYTTLAAYERQVLSVERRNERSDLMTERA